MTPLWIKTFARIAASGCVALSVSAYAAKPPAPHACSAAAIDQAEKLMKFQLLTMGIKGDRPDGSDQVEIEKTSVKRVGTMPALVGKAKYDVLQVYGHVRKATYRMRLYYARLPQECVLMGQEVLERADIN